MSTCNALARGVISFIEEKDWLRLIETIKFFADKFSKKFIYFYVKILLLSGFMLVIITLFKMTNIIYNVFRLDRKFTVGWNNKRFT